MRRAFVLYATRNTKWVAAFVVGNTGMSADSADGLRLTPSVFCQMLLFAVLIEAISNRRIVPQLF